VRGEIGNRFYHYNKERKMKVLAILGSRNPEGQTARAVSAFCKGVETRGDEVERVFLPELDIRRCRQCQDDGWGTCRAEGRCSLEDDFAEVVEQIAVADATVFATPVYYGDLSESMRALLDRLRRICTNGVGKQKVEEKPAIGLCVAGGSGGGTPSCLASLDKVLNTCGFDLIDLIPVRRQNFEYKLEVLKNMGGWSGSGAQQGA
jgi:multimeric flavodoxin WrbA